MTPRLAILVLAATLGAASPAAADQEAAPRAVSVSGEGSISAAPDLAIVTSGVATAAPTAGDALKTNAAAMSKVLAALKQAGVEDRDVATSGLTVQPQYDYGRDDSGPRSPKLVGYEVRNVVTIRARRIEGLGALVDALVAAGSNQIDGVAFEVSDRGTKLDEARRAAVADARRKAELYAAAAGVKLGPALAIEEEAAADDSPRPFAMRAKAMDAAPATPIARGEQELKSRVTVRWKLEG